ncbi:hypothetical protein FN846DRAFT_549436 [Sphaerosporella brunnea]|uniref:Uncharacterized protein n=1 Tax=Sphaerosporella brunnea TaxID=1250544 RepID=A0A5J5EDB3_9PEZI|nr:hypothetical protein FN846DRAFT_549436 [Sphaerosporella brunnea]
MSSEKPLERSVSSTGMNAMPKRSGSRSNSRPRSNTGSRTPRMMMGLGVPAEKYTTRGLGRKKSNRCLAPPELRIPTMTSLPGSGVVTPEVVVTPAGWEGDDEDASSSENSDLSALGEDKFSRSPPGGAAEPSLSSILRNSGSRPRTRRNTMMSEKSVNFAETINAVETAAAPADTLQIKTVEFADPDPTFHRSSKSPLRPSAEAVVEQVGCFRVANLRNDSLGNLPKILSTTSEETSPNDAEYPDIGWAQEDGTGAKSSLPKITVRCPSTQNWSSDFKIVLPKRNPCSVFSSGATTAVSSIHDAQPIISSPGIATANPQEEDAALDGKKGGSVAASLKSVQDILCKNESPSAPPSLAGGSRRSSAWAVGKGSLGLSIDVWNGGVQGTAGR